MEKGDRDGDANLDEDLIDERQEVIPSAVMFAKEFEWNRSE
jgi:hypothetical protein